MKAHAIWCFFGFPPKAIPKKRQAKRSSVDVTSWQLKNPNPAAVSDGGGVGNDSGFFYSYNALQYYMVCVSKWLNTHEIVTYCLWENDG